MPRAAAIERGGGGARSRGRREEEAKARVGGRAAPTGRMDDGRAQGSGRTPPSMLRAGAVSTTSCTSRSACSSCWGRRVVEQSAARSPAGRQPRASAPGRCDVSAFRFQFPEFAPATRAAAARRTNGCPHQVRLDARQPPHAGGARGPDIPLRSCPPATPACPLEACRPVAQENQAHGLARPPAVLPRVVRSVPGCWMVSRLSTVGTAARAAGS